MYLRVNYASLMLLRSGSVVFTFFLRYCWYCRWAVSKRWMQWWPTNSWLSRRTVTLVMERQQNNFWLL